MIAPIPVISSAKARPSPSTRKANSMPSAGTQLATHSGASPRDTGR
jgi:hypothetical protein